MTRVAALNDRMWSEIFLDNLKTATPWISRLRLQMEW